MVFFSPFTISYREVRQACRLVAAIAQDLTTAPLLDDDILDVITQFYPSIFLSMPTSIRIEEGGIFTPMDWTKYIDRHGHAVNPGTFLLALIAVHVTLRPAWDCSGYDTEKAQMIQTHIIDHHPELQGAMMEYLEAIGRASMSHQQAQQDLLHLVATSSLFHPAPDTFQPYNLASSILTSPAFVLNRHKGDERSLRYNLDLVMQILTGWIKQDFRHTVLARHEAGPTQPIDGECALKKYTWLHVMYAFIRADLIVAQHGRREVTAGQFNDSLATIPAVKEWMTAPNAIKSNIEFARKKNPAFPTEADERAITVTQALLAEYGFPPSSPSMPSSTQMPTCSAAPYSTIKVHRETTDLGSLCRRDRTLIVPRRDTAFVPELKLPLARGHRIDIAGQRLIRALSHKTLREAIAAKAVAGPDVIVVTSGTTLAQKKKTSYLCSRKQTSALAARTALATRTAKAEQLMSIAREAFK